MLIRVALEESLRWEKDKNAVVVTLPRAIEVTAMSLPNAYGS